MTAPAPVTTLVPAAHPVLVAPGRPPAGHPAAALVALLEEPAA